MKRQQITPRNESGARVSQRSWGPRELFARCLSAKTLLMHAIFCASGGGVLYEQSWLILLPAPPRLDAA